MKLFWAIALTMAATGVVAAPVGDLTTFVSGTPARASEVNGNFTAVKTAVDDNDARIRALELALSSMQETLASTRTALEAAQKIIEGQGQQIVALEAAIAANATELSAHAASLTAHATALTAHGAELASQAAELAAHESELATQAAELASQSGTIEGIRNSPVMELNPYLTVTTTGSGSPRALFSGINLQLVSGAGSTSATPNGLGNLIIGYDEPRVGAFVCSVGMYGGSPVTNATACADAGGQWGVSFKTGSHNLVLGRGNNYTSYGGLLAGEYNTISGPLAIAMGRNNIAFMTGSAVLGGERSWAYGAYSAVLGGYANFAGGTYSTIGGGTNNSASGNYSVVSGGDSNNATALVSVVSGGRSNTAAMDWATVSGGEGNSANWPSSTVGGGRNRSANAAYQWVAGTLVEAW